MESAISDLPNLPARYAVLKDVRNEDKVAKVARNAPSLETFRAEVYALWRAFGRDWH
jgi:hypothetical protein